jgi:hypothetical protein
MAQRPQQRQQGGSAPAQQPLPNPSDGLDAPISESHMSQAPMNLTDDAESNSRASESTKDTHEYIREVNGRHYNAQNTTYFLPAGESSNHILPAIGLYMPSRYA